MKKYFILIFLLPLIIFHFQNCGKGGNVLQDHEIESRAQFFAYPYLQKPEYYYEIFLSKETVSNSTTDRYKILANVASASGDQTEISFQMDIQDMEGNTLCPSYQGQLEIKSSLIEYECVGVQDQVDVVVILSLTANSKTFEIKKTLKP